SFDNVFTVQNLRQTRLSANWDFLVRIPERLPDKFICLQGDLQASLFYKGVTLVTSSKQITEEEEEKN
ncbi:unnamed protein product, partial [Thlaspi arvense]